MKKIMFLTAIVWALVFTAAAQKEIKVPRAAQAITDGKVEEKEWSDAAVFDLRGGGRFYLKHDGDYVFAAVRGVKPGWTHLYLSESDGGDISVLHASAALGRVIYRRDGNDLWQPLNEFAWELRDRVFTDEVRRKMSAYLAKNYWTASNNNLGNKGEVEFQIKLNEFAGKGLRLAVVYAVDRDAYHFFPAGLADETLRPELVSGNRVENVKFDRRQWARITLENKKTN